MNPLLRGLSEIVLRLLRTIDLPRLGALCGLMVASLAVLYSAGGESMGQRLEGRTLADVTASAGDGAPGPDPVACPARPVSARRGFPLRGQWVRRAYDDAHE